GIVRQLAPGITARIFPGVNAMLSVVTLEPHSVSPVHSHPNEQWGVCLEGEWIRIQDGVEHHVKAGDFWQTPPHVPPGGRPRDGPFFDRFRALGLTVAEVPTGRLGPRPLLATVRLIRRLGIEVVHTHGKGAGLHGRLAARWTGAAAVHTFHGIHYESYRRPLQPLYLGLERRLACWTHTVIHVSPTQEAEARRLGLAGSDPSVTVTNGVDLDEQDRRVAASPLSRAGLGLGADW